MENAKKNLVFHFGVGRQASFLKIGYVKYDWNEPPEPQLVPFCDFVGVNIAPVTKKTAVKWI